MRGISSLFCALVISTAATLSAQQAEYVRGELLATEDFNQGLRGWQAEGDINARIEDGRLRFESTEKSAVKKGNIWWKQRFEGPLRIEFDYQSITEHGLTMFWFNSRGRGGKDLLKQKRTGDYLEYVFGEMDGYHVTFHRFGSGVSNLRKSRGFHLLSSVPDPIPPDDLRVHHIAVSVLGNRIVVEVDGRVLHDFTDEGQPCAGPEEWVHTLPCKGTGGIFTSGYIGIRHTDRQAAFYDNFRVWRMVRQ